MVSILVDQRERSSPVWPLLGAAEDLEVSAVVLQVGDYVVADRVAVERKTLADLHASIASGRLFRQANRLAHSRRRSVLLVEAGPLPPAQRLPRAAVQGALVSVATVFALPILRSRGPEETVWLLRAIARQTDRVQASGRNQLRIRASDAYAGPLRLLASIRGVGPGRARSILDHFGSLEAVFTASQRDLRRVPGVGRRTSEALRALATARRKPAT